MLLKRQLLKEVIVVDDSPESKRKKEMREFLEILGFRIEWHRNWNDLINFYDFRIRKGLSFPNLVFMDLHFSEEHLVLGDNTSKEGYLMTKAILEYCGQKSIHLPAVVIYTSVENTATAMAAISVGATDFISAAEFSRKGHLSKRLYQILLNNNYLNEQQELAKSTDVDVDLNILASAKKIYSNDLKKVSHALNWPLDQVIYLNQQMIEGV